MSMMDVLLYLVAAAFYVIGCMYIVALVIAQEFFGLSLSAVDFLGISLWVTISFLLGTFLIWYIRRKHNKKSEKPKKIKRQLKVSKVAEPIKTQHLDTPNPPLQQEPVGPPVGAPPIRGNTTEDDEELKLLYTLGEITKEEYKRRKDLNK